MQARRLTRVDDDPDLMVWAIVAGYFLLSAIAFALSNFRIIAWEVAGTLLPMLSGAALCVTPRVRRSAARLVRIAGTLLQVSFCGMATAMLACSAARLALPLVDRRLLQFDRLLGYDWDAFTSFVVGHPTIEATLEAAYFSLDWQPIIVVVALGFAGDARRLNRYVMSYLVAMVLTVGVFALWPATTAWVHLRLPPGIIGQHHLTRTLDWTDSLMAIRSGAPVLISSRTNFAIIGFPSFHCAAALLNAWALFDNRWFRSPFLVLNAMMIAATPMMGGHYIADLFAAMLVAAVAARCAHLLHPARGEVAEGPEWSVRPAAVAAPPRSALA